MKRTFIYLTLFTLIFSQPGLVLAAEEALAPDPSIITSPETMPAEPAATAEPPIVLEPPLENPPVAEPPVSIEPTPPVLDPATPPEIIESLPAEITESPAVETEPLLANENNEAMVAPLPAEDAVNSPGRDEGEEGAYQQEKSALNNYKKEAGLTGSLRVDQFSGAASYNLGLDVPAGRNGLNPSLLLAYNSHDKSNDSWVGQGWGLDFGFIQRSSKKGVNNLYTSDEFTLSLGGQSAELILVDEENHLYAPKQESGFLKIQYLPDSSSWLVTDTNGIKYYFGQTAASRQDSGELIFKWQLDKILDTNDNFYRLTYQKREGQIYPQNIYYTGHGETDGPMEILFNLEERGEDNATSYQTQFLVTTDRRLNNIEIKVENQTVSRYQFAYSSGQNGRTSLLRSITKKGYQNDQEYSLPATTFTYQQKQSGWTDDTDNWSDIAYFNPGDGPAEQLVDFNGDSWTDRNNRFHNGSDWQDGNWQFPQVLNLWDNIEIGDINGDKYPDIITTIGGAGGWKPAVYINNRLNGFNYQGGWSESLPDFMTSQHRFEMEKIAIQDINGDGLADLISAYDISGLPLYQQRREIYLNTGSGWNSNYGNFPISLASCDANGMNCESSGVQIADINADGLTDVFNRGRVYLNLGNGFEQEQNENWSAPELPQGFGNAWEYGGARLTDVNSDGLLDIVLAAQAYFLRDHRWDNYESFATYLNTGSGWEINNDWNIQIPIAHNYTDLGARLMDINNDGSMDVVKSYREHWGDNNVVRAVYLGNGIQGDLLSIINNGYSAETEIAYQASARYFNEDNSFKNPKLPFNLQTVKQITTTDGQGGEIITVYDYQDGAFYANSSDYTLNQFAGFGVVTSKTGDQVIKTYYHQGSGIDGYSFGEYEDTIYKKGRAYREEALKDEEGQLVLLSAKVNTWKEEDLGSGRKFVYLDGSVNYDYTAEGEERQMSMPRHDWDAAFNPVAAAQANIQNQQALSTSQLAELQTAQTFLPQVEPQLVVNLSSEYIKHYFIGYNEDNQPKYQAIFRYNNENNEEPERDEQGEYLSGSGDGIFSYDRNADRIRIIGNFNELVVSNNDGIMQRSFLPFDTSNLPDEARIYQVALNVEVIWVPRGISTYLVEFLPANPQRIDINDYFNFGDIWGGNYNFSENDERERTEIEFNEEGLSWISKTGITFLGLKPDSLGWVSFYASEADGEEHDPYLVIEYTMDQPPTATELQVNSQTNPEDIINDELSFSAIYNIDNEEEQAIAYQIQIIETGGDFRNPDDIIWDSDQQNLNTPLDLGQRSEDIEYTGEDLSLEGLQYFWRIKFWNDGDEITSEGYWSSGHDYFYMDGSAAPQPSANLLTEGKTNPIDLINQTPAFSAIYLDPNPIDSAKWYQIQVDDNNDFSSPVWNSQKTLLNNLIDNGSRSEEIVFGGEPLPYEGLTYYWRIKFWDDEGEEGTAGAWSQAAQFSMFNAEDVLENVQAKAVKFHYDFETGNLIQEENLGVVATAENGVFLNEEEEAGDEKNSSYEYAEPIEAETHILAAPKLKTIIDPITLASTTIELYYDDLEFGRVEKANATKEDLNQPNVIYEKDFNAYGLVTSTKDPLNHLTRFGYNEDNYYPTSTTNHLNQITQTEYDLTSGQIKRIVDPNGVVEERDYDSFGRLMQVRKTNPASVNLLVMQNYEYHDTDNPSWVRQVNYPGQSFEQSIYTYFDGLGRTIQTREQSETANQFRVSSIAYDERGNVAKQSLVYFANDPAYQEPDWDQPRTEYTYDAQNRVLTEEFIGGDNHYLTTYEYDGWNVLIIDPNGKQKKLYKDAYGQLIQTDEYLAGEIYSTRYTYNLLGKITNITDSQGNERNFTYDDLGRLLSQEEMHRFEAENFGVWQYQYDAASNLVSKTDPKGQRVRYTYDGLNRLLTEQLRVNNSWVTKARYAYDSGNYGKGRLYSATVSPTITYFTYDKWGRVLREDKRISAQRYLTNWTYNLASWPLTLTYPDNSRVYYDYNNNGLTTRVRIKDAGSNVIGNFITGVSYSPLKQISEVRYTNNTVSTNTYDPAQGYRLTRKRTVNETGVFLQDLSGNGYDGAITAGAGGFTTNRFNQANEAYDFDGTATRINLGDVLDMGTADFTVSAWFKKDVAGTGGYIASKRVAPSTSPGWQITILAGNYVSAYISDSNTNSGNFTSGVNVADGQWHHVAAVFDRDYRVTKYVDGVNDGSRSIVNEQSSIDNAANFVIGWRSDLPVGAFDGKVDELEIFNTVLTVEQIREIYQAGVPAALLENGNLLASYSLDQEDAEVNSTVLQDLTYTYDNVGNITRLADESETLLAKTTDYSYDDLYRLLGVRVTNSANEADYEQAYSYDPIGNILSKSDIGDYLYQTSNPYQASRIADADYQYDLNGNLVTDGSKTYEYDHNDRLKAVSIDENNALFNFYDHNGQRTLKQLVSHRENGEVFLDTAYYPNKYSEVQIKEIEGNVGSRETVKTSHVYLGNQVVAHISKTNVEAPVKSFIFSDHLGSSSIITDATGTVQTLYDYYPFGGTRLEQEVGEGEMHAAGFQTDYRYTGKELDKEIGLHYYGARYYEAATGRFTQSDPVSLKIAMSNEVKKVTGQTQQQLLTNPQVLNSYAYTVNNPVKYTDPDGQFFFLIPLIPYVFTATVAALGAYATWEVGQSAGYAIEGDTAQSSAHTGNAMLAFAGVAAVGEGALAVMPLTVTNTSPRGQLIINEEARTVSVSNGSNIRFKQTWMKSNFSSELDTPDIFKNKSVDEIASQIKSGNITVDQVPVNYINRNGYRLVDNTRSSVALQKAGIDPSQWNWRQITDSNRIQTINNQLKENNLSFTGSTYVTY